MPIIGLSHPAGFGGEISVKQVALLPSHPCGALGFQQDSGTKRPSSPRRVGIAAHGASYVVFKQRTRKDYKAQYHSSHLGTSLVCMEVALSTQAAGAGVQSSWSLVCLPEVRDRDDTGARDEPFLFLSTDYAPGQVLCLGQCVTLITSQGVQYYLAFQLHKLRLSESSKFTPSEGTELGSEPKSDPEIYTFSTNDKVERAPGGLSHTVEQTLAS